MTKTICAIVLFIFALARVVPIDAGVSQKMETVPKKSETVSFTFDALCQKVLEEAQAGATAGALKMVEDADMTQEQKDEILNAARFTPEMLAEIEKSCDEMEKQILIQISDEDKKGIAEQAYVESLMKSCADSTGMEYLACLKQSEPEALGSANLKMNYPYLSKPALETEPVAATVDLSGAMKLGETVCTVIMAGDVDAFFELMPLEMLEKTAEMLAQFSEEPIADPIAEMKKEMKAEMLKQPMESCRVVSARARECNEEMIQGFEMLDMTAPSQCAALTMTVKMKGEEGKTDDIPVFMIDGVWYLGGM